MTTLSEITYMHTHTGAARGGLSLAIVDSVNRRLFYWEFCLELRIHCFDSMPVSPCLHAHVVNALRALVLI